MQPCCASSVGASPEPAQPDLPATAASLCLRLNPSPVDGPYSSCNAGGAVSDSSDLQSLSYPAALGDDRMLMICRDMRAIPVGAATGSTSGSLQPMAGRACPGSWGPSMSALLSWGSAGAFWKLSGSSAGDGLPQARAAGSPQPCSAESSFKCADTTVVAEGFVLRFGGALGLTWGHRAGKLCRRIEACADALHTDGMTRDERLQTPATGQRHGHAHATCLGLAGLRGPRPRASGFAEGGDLPGLLPLGLRRPFGLALRKCPQLCMPLPR